MIRAVVPVRSLRGIVGKRHVLTAEAATRPYRTGYRCGKGAAAAVVRPGSLVELWRVVNACVEANAILIPQAANTGLTGGSTPDGDDYDRDVVIVSTTRLTGIHVIAGGAQVVCLAGARLHDLEAKLAPLGREPHSVIGSSCIGASVVGGVCNNSGGSLIGRGPAFTTLALFAQIGAAGEVRLVNHIGIRLRGDPETVLGLVDRGCFDSDAGFAGDGPASDRDYGAHVRQIDAPTPARYNADPRCLFEAAGSAGKLIVFAVRLDTFPRPDFTRTFYIGTNKPAELSLIRRHMLTEFETLPVAAEYIHREAFDLAERYGKDAFLAIQMLGARRLPALLAGKQKVDSLAIRFGRRPGFSDRMLQRISRVMPRHLPPTITAYRDRFEHHLLLRMSGAGVAAARSYLSAFFPTEHGAFFECTSAESEKAFRHRFVVAGAAVRYRSIHAAKVEDVVALDIALPRNAENWLENLPEELDSAFVHKIYYGHFFCHVFHQDYIVRKNHDAINIKNKLLTIQDSRYAKYPAEHGFGHLYSADSNVVAFYRKLDPQNRMNPGIGRTSKNFLWREDR